LRKKISSIIFVAAIAIAAAWNFTQNKAETELSDLALENVKALADGESAPVYDCPGGWTICVQVNNGTWFFKR
jgi:hypothetical protein